MPGIRPQQGVGQKTQGQLSPSLGSAWLAVSRIKREKQHLLSAASREVGSSFLGCREARGLVLAGHPASDEVRRVLPSLRMRSREGIKGALVETRLCAEPSQSAGSRAPGSGAWSSHRRGRCQSQFY